MVILGGLEADGLAGEGADHQNALAGVLAGVHEQLVAALVTDLEITVADTGQALSQFDGLAVEIQDGIGVLFLLLHVDNGTI